MYVCNVCNVCMYVYIIYPNLWRLVYHPSTVFSRQESDMFGVSLLRFCRLIRLVRVVKVFRLRPRGSSGAPGESCWSGSNGYITGICCIYG